MEASTPVAVSVRLSANDLNFVTKEAMVGRFVPGFISLAHFQPHTVAAGRQPLGCNALHSRGSCEGDRRQHLSVDDWFSRFYLAWKSSHWMPPNRSRCGRGVLHARHFHNNRTPSRPGSDYFIYNDHSKSFDQFNVAVTPELYQAFPPTGVELVNARSAFRT